MLLDWNDIAAQLHTLAPVAGGFSSARRGLVTLAAGRRVFVKIAVDELTAGWVKKEIAAYRFLEQQGYAFAPRLLACSDTETGFALEPLTPQDGWDWAEVWTDERLDQTLRAMDALAAIRPAGADAQRLSEEGFGRGDDGWQPLARSGELQKALRDKLQANGREDIAASLDIAAEAARSQQFIFQNNALVHYDVRADNCPWHGGRKEVRVVDWNWLQIGDRRIDQAAMLVHVHKSGLDVRRNHADRLDADALQWMAGFWFKACATPIWPGGPAHLRDFQLRAALAALELSGWQHS